MKKIIYFLFACIIIITSCKSQNKKNFSGNVTKLGNAQIIEANKIIDYTNTVSEVVEVYTNAAADAVEDYDATFKAWSKNEDVIGVFSTDMDFLAQQKTKADIAFAPPIPELKADVVFFKDSVGLFKNLFQQFTENNNALKLYISAKNYKDDKYAKGKDLLDKQFEIYTQLARLFKSIHKKIALVADYAEAVSQQNSPLKNAYKACKGDCSKMKALVDFMFSKQEKFTTEDIATIDKLFTEFTTSIEQNKTANKDELEKSNKAPIYTMFYDRIITENANMKAVIRNIKSTNILSEVDYSLLDASYNNTVSVYNAWVQ